MATGDEHTDQHRPFALVGLGGHRHPGGAALGALTNSINGWVSPLYFRNILDWHDVDDVWRASIAQGIFEGLMFGLFLALVFTIVVGCVSKARCSYRFGVVILMFVAVAALVCWAVGGLLGMGLADPQPGVLSPRLHRRPAGLRRDAPLRLGRRLDLGHRVRRVRPDDPGFVPVLREVEAAGVRNMNVKQLKALRKGQYELMQTLRGQLDEDSYHRLNDYLSSADSARQGHQHYDRSPLARGEQEAEAATGRTGRTGRTAPGGIDSTPAAVLRGTGGQSVGRRSQVSEEDRRTGGDRRRTSTHRRTGRKRIASAQCDGLHQQGIHCGKALLQHRRSCTGCFALRWNAAVLCIDQKKDIRLNWGDFDIVPYLTNKGWNVFICLQGGTEPQCRRCLG